MKFPPVKLNWSQLLRGFALATLLGAAVSAASADNIDQNNNTASRYAWGENIGWLKARPVAEPYAAGGSGLQVTDTDVLGYMWGENIGWVNMSCKNDNSCGAAAGIWGVTNDGAGHLKGYAWAENAGWINFACASDNSCGGGAGTWGVTIATPGTFDYLKDWGVFHGYAWGENVGWINFNCQNDASCGTSSFQIQTGWPNSSGDGYTDTQHAAIGKNPFVYCPIMRADVNGSGTVTLADLILTAQKYLQPVPPTLARYDQNADGKISLADLILIAGRYLKPVSTCP